MRVITISLENDWLDRVALAIGEGGSNDEEHDLLVLIAEEVASRVRPGVDLAARVTEIEEATYGDE